MVVIKVTDKVGPNANQSPRAEESECRA